MQNAAGDLNAIGAALAGIANPTLKDSLHYMAVSAQHAGIDLGVTTQALARFGIIVGNLPTPIQAATAQLQQLAATMQRGVQGVQQFTQSIMGMARAGLQGTLEGNRLSYAWQLLCQQIASVFLPVINTATRVIIEMRNALAGLSGMGQNIVMVIGGIVGGFFPLQSLIAAMAPVLLMVVKLLSVKVAIIAALAAGIAAFLSTAQGHELLATLGKALGAVMGLFSSIAGLFGDVLGVALQLFVGILQLLEPIINLVIKGISLFVQGLTWLIQKIRDFLDWIGLGSRALVRNQADESRRNVTPGKISFEGIGDAMERITLAANKDASMEIARSHLEVARHADGTLGELLRSFMNFTPATIR